MWHCWTHTADAAADVSMTQLLTWRLLLRRLFRRTGFSGDFSANFGELYKARFNSDFDDLYTVGIVSTRRIYWSDQNSDLRTFKKLKFFTETKNLCF